MPDFMGDDFVPGSLAASDQDIESTARPVGCQFTLGQPLLVETSESRGTFFEFMLCDRHNTPFARAERVLGRFRDAFSPKMARPPRLERGTLCLEGRCSIQLSYGRNPDFTGYCEGLKVAA